MYTLAVRRWILENVLDPVLILLNLGEDPAQPLWYQVLYALVAVALAVASIAVFVAAIIFGI